MSLSINEKRLLKDVININKHPLTEHGIFYIHDSDNIKKGYALIIGPKDTIYSHGMYFFEFNYPNDYPFSPPKVTYLTNGEGVRFNPNLYRSGKVCISILNTWNGPQWSSCQTISSVLLTLTTLFHNKPLLNEPGLTESHRSFKDYNKIIRYSSIKVALLSVLNKKICVGEYDKFKSYIIDYVNKNKQDIIDDIVTIDSFLVASKKTYITTAVYNINLRCLKRGKLLKIFNETFQSLN
jgi:ubiquitin-protein ligase